MELPIHKCPSFHPNDNVVKKRVDSHGFGPGFVKFRDAKGNIQLGCYFCGEQYGRVKPVDRIDRHMISSHFRSLKYNWLKTDEALAAFKRSLPQYICSLCDHVPFYRTDGYSMHMRKIHKYPLTWKPTRVPTKRSSGVKWTHSNDSHDESLNEDEQDATEHSELDGVHRIIDEDYDGDEPSDIEDRPIGIHRPIDEDYDGDEDEQEAIAQRGAPESADCNLADEPELSPMEVIQEDETLLSDPDQMEVVKDRMECPPCRAPILGTRGRLSPSEQEEFGDVEDDQLDPGEYEPSDGEDVCMHSYSDVENRKPGPPLQSVFAQMARPDVLASRTNTAGRLSSMQGPSSPLSSGSPHAQKSSILSQKDGQINPEAADKYMRGRSVYKPKSAGHSKLHIDIQPRGAVQDAALSAPPHAPTFGRHARMSSMPPPIRFSPVGLSEAIDSLQQKRSPSGEVSHQDVKRPRIEIPLPSGSTHTFTATRDTYAQETNGLMVSHPAEAMQVIRRPAVFLQSADIVGMDRHEQALRENMVHSSLLPLRRIPRGNVPYGAWVSMGAQGRPVFIPLSILQHGIDAFRASNADAILDSDIALYVRTLSPVQRLALADFVEKTIRGEISDIDFLRRLGD